MLCVDHQEPVTMPREGLPGATYPPVLITLLAQGEAWRSRKEITG